VSFVALEGWVVVDGYQPDGDTIRFVPDDMRAFQRLEGSHRASYGKDTSVCVRLEGIDAPELHYAGAEQPAAKPALDALLRGIHWPTDVGAQADGAARATIPRGVRVLVVTRGCDVHGRAIGYLFAGARHDASVTAEWLTSADGLATSVNARLVADGLVYPLSYTSQPEVHRALFRSLARRARSARAGVWARDESRSGFVLRSDASLGRYGALVFPKVFRRSVTFFREGPRGVGFREWLRDWSGDDDRVSVDGRPPRPLSALLVADRQGRIRLTSDVSAMTFLP